MFLSCSPRDKSDLGIFVYGTTLGRRLCSGFGAGEADGEGRLDQGTGGGAGLGAEEVFCWCSKKPMIKDSNLGSPILSLSVKLCKLS